MESHTKNKNFRKFGNLDFSVSAVGLGTWAMGGKLRDPAERKNAEEAIASSVEAGINLIDTAAIYSFGESEIILGQTMKKLKCRDRVILATKFGLEWDEKCQHLRRNSSRARLLREIDDSRRRLQTDVIDIYQIHWPDVSTPIAETMETLVKLYQSGTIRAIGVSNFSVVEMKDALRYGPIHSLQPPYNLFEQESGLEIIPFCRENGIQVLTYGAICRGLLSGKYKDDSALKEGDIRHHDPKFRKGTIEAYLAAVEELKNMAAGKQCEVSQLATAWVFHQPGVTSAITGAKSGAQAKTNAGALSVQLSESELLKIEEIVSRNVPNPIGAGFLAPPKTGYKKLL